MEEKTELTEQENNSGTVASYKENGGVTMPPSKYNSEQFYKDLIVLINKHCMENQNDTPDYILADYIMNSLMAFTATTLKRDKWWSFKTWNK